MTKDAAVPWYLSTQHSPSSYVRVCLAPQTPPGQGAGSPYRPTTKPPKRLDGNVHYISRQALPTWVSISVVIQYLTGRRRDQPFKAYPEIMFRVLAPSVDGWDDDVAGQLGRA